jgi:hypothetical protein
MFNSQYHVFPPTLDSLMMLYFTLVRSKLEYASVEGNSITATGANKLDRLQRKLSALSCSRLKNDIVIIFFRKVKFQTPHTRRRHSDALPF